MKKRGICLLPDACYLSELNVPGKPNRTNLGECAAIQRFLSTHPNENLAILTPYRNQRALLAGTAKKSSYPQEVSLTVHRAQEREYLQSHAQDELLKIYRREYKRRFAWIRAGKISQEAFCAWSKDAQKEKEKCKNGEIDQKEFT